MPGVVSQTHSSGTAPRELNAGYISYEDACSYRLLDGTPIEIVVPKLGFARKTDSNATRVNSTQLAHAAWCQSIGDKTVHPNGSKMFPSEMERTMRLHGTAAGEQDYPTEVHMRARASGQPTFKLAELLNAQQLKAYASKTRPKLLNQLKNLREKEAKEATLQAQQHAAAVAEIAEKAADPDGYRVNRMNALALKAELKASGQRHSGNVSELKPRLHTYLLSQNK